MSYEMSYVWCVELRCRDPSSLTAFSRAWVEYGAKRAKSL